MKKLFLVLAVAAFAACNNSGDGEEVKPDTTSQAPVETPTTPPADTTTATADTTAAQ